MNGEFGPIDELKINLDYIYSRVQEKINEITQEELKNKSIEDIAYDVIKGKYGTGEYRKNILGNLYEKVNNKVNEILDAVKKIEKKEINEINEKEQNSNGNKINEDKNLIQASGIEKLSIEELSNKVIRGEFGNGKIRKQKLGDLYPIVQNRVNERLGCNARCDIDETSIEILAKRVIRGEFGNGKERKSKLGELYPYVQNKVNKMLGCPTVYEEKPKPDYIKLK